MIYYLIESFSNYSLLNLKLKNIKCTYFIKLYPLIKSIIL